MPAETVLCPACSGPVARFDWQYCNLCERSGQVPAMLDVLWRLSERGLQHNLLQWMCPRTCAHCTAQGCVRCDFKGTVPGLTQAAALAILGGE